jgi:hypothetical protein
VALGKRRKSPRGCHDFPFKWMGDTKDEVTYMQLIFIMTHYVDSLDKS